jgi:SAM-dependent methyltransferase
MLAKHQVEGAHPGGLQLTSEILAREYITSGTSLLDVGCGTGQTSAFIAKKYQCNVTAADINTAMLSSAFQRFREENVKVELYQADAMQLPFKQNSFDIVLAESVTIFTTIIKAVKEYFRVLKINGTFIDIELTAEIPLIARELSEICPVYGIETIPTQDEWCRTFQSCGFTRVQTAKVGNSRYWSCFTPQMALDFLPHLIIMNKYGTKLGYRIYRCKI